MPETSAGGCGCHRSQSGRIAQQARSPSRRSTRRLLGAHRERCLGPADRRSGYGRCPQEPAGSDAVPSDQTVLRSPRLQHSGHLPCDGRLPDARTTADEQQLVCSHGSPGWQSHDCHGMWIGTSDARSNCLGGHLCPTRHSGPEGSRGRGGDHGAGIRAVGSRMLACEKLQVPAAGAAVSLDLPALAAHALGTAEYAALQRTGDPPRVPAGVFSCILDETRLETGRGALGATHVVHRGSLEGRPSSHGSGQGSGTTSWQQVE